MHVFADALAADPALRQPARVGLTIRLQLLDAGAGADDLAGHAVYLWHCGRDGLYSLYSNGFGAQSYLRGLQQADRDGAVTFRGVFPACYAGHAPQVHLEVYPSPARGGSAANRIHTIAFTFPLAVLRDVYGCPGYEQSARHLAQIEAAGMVGTGLPVAPVSGNASDGYELALRVPIAA
jgi:hypothetical protein